MHYPTLLLALFTTAVLAKDPWVRSYYNADCTGTPANDKAKVKDADCVPFDSVYDTVAINYGTEGGEIDSMSVFSDENCTVPAAKPIQSDPSDGTPQQCVSQSKNGGKWRSVQAKLVIAGY